MDDHNAGSSCVMVQGDSDDGDAWMIFATAVDMSRMQEKRPAFCPFIGNGLLT